MDRFEAWLAARTRNKVVVYAVAFTVAFLFGYLFS